MQRTISFSFLFLCFNLFYWSTVDLQCCGNFSCTAKWFSYTYIYTFLFFKFLFYFWSHCMAWGILVPRPGIEPMPPAVEVQSPNHWTAREVPMHSFSYSFPLWFITGYWYSSLCYTVGPYCLNLNIFMLVCFLIEI